MWCQLVIWSVIPVCLPVTTHRDRGITQICIIILWPDVSETCFSVVGDPPLNDNFIMQQLRVTFYI